MKKTLNFFAFATICLIAFSCTKEESKNPVSEKDPSAEEQVVPAVDGNLLTSFGVSFENAPDAPVTAVSVNIESGVTAIENGDEVLVFVDKDNHAVYTYDDTSLKFVLKDGETPVALNGTASVFYPENEYEIVGTGVKFTMPASIEASGDFGAINPMVGQISGPVGAYTVELQNLISVLKVHVEADVNINSVALEYGSGLNYASDSRYYINPSNLVMDYSDASATTSETCALATPAKSAEVLFLLPTLALTNGLTVTANLADAPNSRSLSKAAYTPVRNKISDLYFAAFFSGGRGTEASPYRIADARDFKNIQKFIASGLNEHNSEHFQQARYIQTANIDFNNEVLTPIGVYNAVPANALPFQGVYNGNDKTLSRFQVSGDKDGSTGLFEYVDGATLQNIAIGTCSVTGTNTTGILTGRCIGNTTIEKCSLTGGQVTGRNSVGFIAHVVGNTSVKNCTVSNITVITADSGENANNQGGVVGFAGGASKIESCSTSGDIQFTGTVSGVARGGIVGKFDSTGEVKGCTNGAEISSLLVNYTGGIAGQLTKGTITECLNTGNVTGLGYVGGITGAMLPASTTCVFVNKCRVDATIEGTGDENTEACVGGIVGSMQNGVLNTCIAKGSVVNSWYDTGGIAGQIYANGADAAYNRPYVFDCIAANDITCTRTSGSSNIGGVVGRINRNGSYTNQYTAVDNCIGLNQTITATIQYAGAFVGNVNASATNNDRVRVRNCISLVDDSHLSVNTSANYTGGFAGSYLGALIHCYYLVSDNNQTAVSGTTAASNLTKSDLATLTGADFCSAHSSRATGYNLTVNSVQYKSSGWTLPGDASYPVPTTLYNLGSEYYK